MDLLIIAFLVLLVAAGVFIVRHQRAAVRAAEEKVIAVRKISIRIEEDHGIITASNHVYSAIAGGSDGHVSLAQMPDGSLQNVLLRGTVIEAYVWDSDRWVSAPRLAEAGKQETV